MEVQQGDKAGTQVQEGAETVWKSQKVTRVM